MAGISEITVIPLAQCPHLAPILAHWSYCEWYLQRNVSFDLNLKAYRQRAVSAKIPSTYVALWGDLPVAMASLKENDLWSRKDLNPWLASVFTLPQFRRQGIAEKLIAHVCQHARQAGYSQLFLFLGQQHQEQLQNYYTRLGFVYQEAAIDNDGLATAILVKQL